LYRLFFTQATFASPADPAKEPGQVRRVLLVSANADPSRAQSAGARCQGGSLVTGSSCQFSNVLSFKPRRQRYSAFSPGSGCSRQMSQAGTWSWAMKICLFFGGFRLNADLDDASQADL